MSMLHKLDGCLLNAVGFIYNRFFWNRWAMLLTDVATYTFFITAMFNLYSMLNLVRTDPLTALVNLLANFMFYFIVIGHLLLHYKAHKVVQLQLLEAEQNGRLDADLESRLIGAINKYALLQQERLFFLRILLMAMTVTFYFLFEHWRTLVVLIDVIGFYLLSTLVMPRRPPTKRQTNFKPAFDAA